MTLTTHVRVLDPYPVREIFDWCTNLVGGDDPSFKGKRPSFSEGTSIYGAGSRHIGNTPWQGLEALIWLDYGADGDLENPADYPDAPTCAIQVSFDTPYGYNNAKGAGCADLHAWIIQEFGRWLDEHHLRWAWENEFTGTWHTGYEDLPTFGDPEKGTFERTEVAHVG